MRKADKMAAKVLQIADALRMLGRGNGMSGGGLTATTTTADVAQVTGIAESEVARMLVEHASLVWGKLPLGWMHRVERNGTIHLSRREG